MIILNEISKHVLSISTLQFASVLERVFVRSDTNKSGGAQGGGRGTGGAGGVRESGEKRAGCGSSKRAESGREMQNATCHLLIRYNT